MKSLFSFFFHRKPPAVAEPTFQPMTENELEAFLQHCTDEKAIFDYIHKLPEGNTIDMTVPRRGHNFFTVRQVGLYGATGFCYYSGYLRSGDTINTRGNVAAKILSSRNLKDPQDGYFVYMVGLQSKPKNNNT